MEKRNFTTVSIPQPLADKTKKFIEGTGFTSLSSFVEYLLREIISDKAAKGKDSNRKTNEDVQDLEDRLRRLPSG